MATLRQKKAIASMVEKGGSVADAMRAAGYSENTIKTPSKLTATKSFQEEVAPIIKKMEMERDAIMAELEKKRGEAGYSALVEGMDKMTKNIQLLSGGKTSNDKISFGWEE